MKVSIHTCAPPIRASSSGVGPCAPGSRLPVQCLFLSFIEGNRRPHLHEREALGVSSWDRVEFL